MKVNTMHAKIVADHSEVYKTLFQYSNIKDGDSILLITLGHPVYYLKLKKEYPNSLILNIEDVNFRFLWTNYLLNVELVNTEDIESLTKFFKERKMKFDHIIANPPYEFGNAITTTVLNNVDFDDYVNLMPVSKYKKGKIYQHIVPNSLKPVKWEGDAFTNPQISMVKKERDPKITEEDFNTWCYDKRFFKFYVENQKRKHYAIDTDNYISTLKVTPSYDTTFFITTRTPQNGIHKTPSCHDYRWNILKIEPLADILDGYNRPRGTFVYFHTKEEKDNFGNWWYNSKIWSQVIWGTYKQSGSPNIFLPKVDWSKEWTDEEILKDYGYSDEEIKELLK